MSLKVWLPLNGTLDNQGLDDITITNNGATIDNSGKIGKCYSFNGSNNYIYFPYSFSNGDWSYSIWFYTIATTTQTLGCCRSAGGLGFSVFLISNKIRIDGIINNSNQEWTTTYIYPINTWVNLIITSKNGLIKYYINGEYQTSKVVTVDNTKLGNVFTVGASQVNGSNLGNYFKGKINDVRIYDHALSPMEVKQISQGLILHYPLNNIGIKENIEYDCSGYCNNGIKTGTFTYDSDTPKYNVSTVFNKASYINIGQPLFYARDEVTVNLWVKADSWTTNPGTFFSSVQSGGYGWQKSSNTYKVYCGTGVSSNTYISVTLNTTSLDASKWHMMTFTYDGMVLKTYIDAVLKTTTSKYSTKTPLFFNSNTSMFIGGEADSNKNTPANTSSYPIFKGNISDIRIYCTALSEEDILSLYKNSVYIDNEGNLYGAELREV